jgi:hypothetical protein
MMNPDTSPVLPSGCGAVAGVNSLAHRRLLRLAAVAIVIEVGCIVWNVLKSVVNDPASDHVVLYAVLAILTLINLTLAVQVWRARWLKGAVGFQILLGVLVAYLLAESFRFYTALGGSTVGVVLWLLSIQGTLIAANAAAVGLILYVLIMRRRRARQGFRLGV